MRRWGSVLGFLLGTVTGGILVKKVWLQKYQRQKRELAISVQESDLLYTWLLSEQKKASLNEYFLAHGYHSIAILGMNRIGRRVFDSLQRCKEISVAYAVESDNFAAVHRTLTVYRLGDDMLPPVDCLVICDMEGVSKKLAIAQEAFSGEIVTFEQILNWLLEYQL